MADWVWDPAKNTRNIARHRLPLAAGALVLEGDPLALSRPDPHPDGDRWQTVGIAGGIVALFVVHTEPGGSARIISVRKATAHERRAYEQGAF